nr:Short-chain dehydrogenase reductase SDR domain containing protein [Haemonchus contortus]
MGTTAGIKLTTSGGGEHYHCSIDELKELSKNCTTPIDAFIMDVTSDQSVSKAKKYLESRTAKFGGLHGLVNNAGILGREFFDDFLTVDDYKEVAEVNAWGVIRVTQAMKPLVKQVRGRIVTITSICSRLGIMGIGPYTTAKFAITGYCDVIRRELRLFGVSVHVLEPGFFKTPLTDTENIDKQLETLYDSCPEDAKREYGAEFFIEMRKKTSWMLSCISSDRIDYVTNTYLHALTAVYPRSRYQVGWDSKLIFIPLAMLPTAIQDLIIRLVVTWTGIPTPRVLQKKIN